MFFLLENIHIQLHRSSLHAQKLKCSLEGNTKMAFNVYISYDHGTINLSMSMMDDKEEL